MDETEKYEILAHIEEIKNPTTGDYLRIGKEIKSLNISNGKIILILQINQNEHDSVRILQKASEQILQKFSKGKKFHVIITSHSKDKTSQDTEVKSSQERERVRINTKQSQVKKNPEGVKKIIAIASGKGGVGKSTVASNLAVATAAQGKKIALLDADVYGPSQPKMLGISGRPSSPDGKTILPLRNHGVTTMSLGLMIPENESIVWRGPMLIGALQQMLNQVQWGEQDILFVDLPPGTGDVQLTLCQKTNVEGAIIVSTPQDIALLDARKGISMFKRVNVPILGLIENMSSFICSGCGMKHHPFNNGTLRAEAIRFGTNFLGELPLDLDTRIASDEGIPIVLSQPDKDISIAFTQLAKNILASVCNS